MKQIIVLVLIFLVFAGCVQPLEPEEETDTTQLEPPPGLPDAGVSDENIQTPAAPAPPINIVTTEITYDLYGNTDYDFELEVPSHWESEKGEAYIKFYGPEGSDEYASSIIVQYLPAQAAGGSYESLQELLQAYKESYEADENTEIVTGFDVQQPLSGAPEGSLEASENARLYREYWWGDRLVVSDIYLLKHGNSFYLLEYLVFKDSYTVSEQYWKQALETFKATGTIAAEPITPSAPQVISPDVPLTQEAIDYFKEIALGLEFEAGYEFITLWLKDPVIKIHGSPTSMDLECLNNAVNQNAALSKTIKPRISDSGENIDIYFTTLDEFPSLVSGYVPGNWGYFSLRWTGSGEITNATILISTDKPTPNARCHLIWEEFTQSLGLKKDSDKYPDSIFYGVYAEDPRGLSELDKVLVSLLYSGNFTPGMTPDEVDSMLERIRTS
jgi:hypothetical protein